MNILQEKKHIPNHYLSASRKHFCGNASLHGHDFFEIEYIISGTGTYCIDGTDHAIRPGTCVLLSPANTHAVSGDMDMINVMFHAECNGEELPLPSAFLNTSPILFPNEKESTLLCAMLTELVETHCTDLRYAMLLLRCVLHKLAILGQGRQTAFSSYVQRAILYVLEHFHKGVTLDETARHLGLSGAYFSDLFLQQTGQHFKTYLDGIRFSYAKNLLAFTGLPVGEVYTRAGFADYANFARRFKAVFGLTPTAYRAQNTEKRKEL